ncbi:MAG: hypothetical protein ACKO0V_00205 [bacterium]
MIRKSILTAGVAGLMVVAGATMQAQTQEKGKSATKSAAAPTTTKSAGASGVDSTRKAADTSKNAADYRRVPQYFGQVDLSDEQREKIYSVRERYAVQQAKLEEELASLQDKVMRECEAVLTAEQRNELTRLRGEAKAKANAKSKSKTAAKTK